MRYNKKTEDIKFRRINTANLFEEEEFGEFLSDYVDYPEGCVMEVMCRDGSKHIEYGQARKVVHVGLDVDKIYFPMYLPRARLWLRDMNGIRYKVPLKLLEQDGNAYVWVPNGANGMFLCGDPYFEAVYELI